MYEIAFCLKCRETKTEPVEDEEMQSFGPHALRHGTWADSETEKALRSLINFAKNYRGMTKLTSS